MDETFDDELAKRLRRYEEEPNENLWHAIVARKDAEDRVFTMRERKKYGLMILAGMLLMSGVEFLYHSGTKNNGPTLDLQSLQSNITAIQRQDGEATSTTLQPIPQHLIPQKSSALKIHAIAQDIRPSESPYQVNVAVEEAAILSDAEDVAILSDTEGPATLSNSEEPVLLTGNDKKQNENLSDADIFADKNENPGPEITKNNSVSTEKKIAQKAVVEKKVVGSEQKAKGKLPSLYFIIMPTFGYNSIKSNSNDNIIIESIERIPTFSFDRLGVRAELGAEDPITKRITVFGGLVYYQRKQTIGYTEKQLDNTQITQGPDGGIILQPEFKYVQKSFEYELRNIGLQVGVNYQLSKRKLLQTAGTGIEFHLALNKLNHSAQAPEFTNNPSAYVFYNLYYRMQYPAEGKFKAVLQPTLNYSLYIDQNLNAPFYVKPYGLGLNIGFTYNFDF